MSGMIEVLESRPINCDILILDRGVFDALCWFSWLNTQKHMTDSHRNNVENFFLLPEFTRLIDIVFVFECDAKTSIEREHATLLTKKLGSIMKPNVLSQYLNAIEYTVEKHGNNFIRIERIDTSKSEQNQVNKEVTSRALEILRDLLMEKIGYINPDLELKTKLLSQRITPFSELDNLLTAFDFDFRETVEATEEFIQPVPIAIITDASRSKVLVVKKNKRSTGADSPEKSKLLMYVGGHSRIEDTHNMPIISFLSICRETLAREIKEEIGISVVLDDITPYVIYTPDNPKSKQHLAICFIVERDLDDISIKLDQSELILNRGGSESGKFFPVDELGHNIHKLESWGIELLKEVFHVDVNPQADANQAIGGFVNDECEQLEQLALTWENI
ncbi:MAG: hypothetical protein FWB91_09625 [Defluviitaleaceae bacterium]|nr:hypothetical protein [Defluviitaleaceae bacterium]